MNYEIQFNTFDKTPFALSEANWFDRATPNGQFNPIIPNQ